VRVNGWQRIGIVASVIWAVGAYFVAIGQPDLATSLHRSCLAATPEANHAEWVARCYTEFKERLPGAMQDRQEAALLFALMPIPIGWLLVYTVIWVGRWIHRGFKPA
jgi:hypothetical protein